MKISIFLSYPKPAYLRQRLFIDAVRKNLEARGFGPRTLGVTDYDMDAPLRGIRRLMLESNGLITVAFRRTLLVQAHHRADSDIPGVGPTDVSGAWLTTPWAHIEPAMAYQLGLPILIFREKGVLADGILERGIVGLYMPEFDLDLPLEDYFESEEWKGIVGAWEGRVRAVVDKKGSPPVLF